MHARMHMRVHAKLAYTPTYEHAPTHTLCLSVPPPPPFSDARILSLTHTHTHTHTHTQYTWAGEIGVAASSVV